MSKFLPSFLKKKRTSLPTECHHDEESAKVRKVKKRQKKGKSDQRHSMHDFDIDKNPQNILSSAKSTSDLQHSDSDSLLDNLSEIAAGVIPEFPTSSFNLHLAPSVGRRLSEDSSASERDSSDSCTERNLTDSIDEGLAYESIGNESTEEEKTPLILEDEEEYADDNIDDFMDEALEDLEGDGRKKSCSKKAPVLDIVYAVTSENEVKFELVEVEQKDSEEEESSRVVVRPTDLPLTETVCDQSLEHSTRSSLRELPSCDKSNQRNVDSEREGEGGRPLEHVYELANNLVAQTLIDAMLRSSSKTSQVLEPIEETEAEFVSLEANSEATNSSCLSSNGPNSLENCLEDQPQIPESVTSDSQCQFCVPNERSSCQYCNKKPSSQSREDSKCISSDCNLIDLSPSQEEEEEENCTAEDGKTEFITRNSSLDVECSSLNFDKDLLEEPLNSPDSGTAQSSFSFNPSDDIESGDVFLCKSRSLTSHSTGSELDDEFDSAKEDFTDDEHKRDSVCSSESSERQFVNSDCLASKLIENNSSVSERYRGGSLNEQSSSKIIAHKSSKFTSIQSSDIDSVVDERNKKIILEPTNGEDVFENTQMECTKETESNENDVIDNSKVQNENNEIQETLIQQETAFVVGEENAITNDSRHVVESPDNSAVESPDNSVINKSISDSSDANGNNYKQKKNSSVSEDSFLMNSVNSKFDEAEARLAQRRAARAEARELRLRELEKQQQEHENEEEQQYAANATAPTLVPESPVRAPSNSRSSAGRSSVSNSASPFSRRSSEDSENDPKDVKAELKEVEEKFRKAMITNAQLDNEKSTLSYEVEFLKDKYSELEESHIQLTKEHKKKCSENEQLRKLTNKLKEEVKAVRRILQERDALIQEYGLVLIGEENGEDEEMSAELEAEMEDDTCYDLSPRKIAIKKALLTQEASELLSKGAAKGSLDVRLKKYAEDKNELEDEVRRLRLELEEQYNMRRRDNGLDYEKQKEASKSINEYKFRLQKAEAEVSSLQANVARLESLSSRYKASAEELEKSEEELKADKRKIQRELRDCQNSLEELELKTSMMEKRFDKMRNARSTLLKDLSQDPV